MNTTTALRLWNTAWLTRAFGFLFVTALALAIGGLRLEALLIVAGAVVVAAMALFWPMGVLYLLLLSVPFASLAELDAGDFTISATEVLVAALVAAWLLFSAARRELRLEGGLLLAPMVWVLGVMLLTTPAAAKLTLAAKETFKWLELMAVFLFVARYVRTPAAAQRILAVLLVAGVAESLYALVQVALGAGPSSFSVGDVLRAHGTFGQPNPFAGYLGTLLPLAVALTLTVRSRWRRTWAALGVVIVLAAFLASQSRGAWVGLAVASIVALLSWSRRSRQLLMPIGYGAAVLTVLGLLGVLPTETVQRLGVVVEYFGVFDVRGVTPTPENWAVVERMAHWQAGWAMFLDHPILGVGAGNYPAVYERYFLPGWVDPLGHAHNYYLNVAAEIGLIGLAGVVALLGLAFARTVRAVGHGLGSDSVGRASVPALDSVAATRAGRDARPTELRSPTRRYWRILAGGLLASLVVFGLHNLFDNLLVHGMSVQIGLLLGLVHVVGARGQGLEDRRVAQQSLTLDP